MRVEFTLTKFALQSGKLISAAREIFGNRVAKYANSNQSLRIDCSAERFIRFQIARNEWGAENGFKELKLSILEPKQPEKTFKESFDN